MNINEKRARLAEVRENLIALAEREGDLTGTDAEDWESLNAEFDSLREEVQAFEAREARVAEVRAFAMNPANVEPTSPQVMRKVESDGYDVRTMSTREKVDVARKLNDEYRGLTAEQRERVEGLIGGDGSDDLSDDALASRATELVLRTGRPEYRSAFRKLLRDPLMGMHALSDDEKRAVAETRGVSTTDASGGYAIPFGLDPTFIQIGNGSTNPFRQISRSFTTGAIDKWRGVTVTEVSASWDAEGSSVSDDTPTWAQPEIDLYKAACFIPATFESMEDVAGLEAGLRVLIMDAKDRLEASTHATGSGSAEPWGVVNRLSPIAASLVTASTRGTFAIGDLFALSEAIPARWEGSNLSFVSHKNVLNDVRQFGTSNNYYGFTVDLTAGGVPAVLGSSWYTASGVTSTLTTGTHIAIHGDFQAAYYIVDRLGATMSYIPHLFSTTTGRPMGQGGWYTYWRGGADVVVTNALRLLKL